MTVVVAHLDRRGESPATILLADFVPGPVEARIQRYGAVARLEPEQ
jgi:hypothetical protein